MLPDFTMEGPIVSEAARHQGRLRPAVIASLLLHAGLVLALARNVIVPAGRADTTIAPAAVRISLVTDSPQRRPQPPPPASVPDEPLPEEPLPETTETPPAATLPDVTPPADTTPAITETTPDPAPGADAQAEPGSGQEIVLDANDLRESISNAMVAYRRDVLDEALRECQQYRERYDRWECPRASEVKSATQERIDENIVTTFRAYTYGHEANARISEELLADMNAMRPLMEDGGVLGTLARQRYDIMAVQYEVLNPGAVPRGVIPGLGAMGGPSTGGVVSLATFGGSGIVILSGLISIGFNGKVSVNGPSRALPFDEDEECDLPPGRQGQRAGGCW